MDNLLKQAQAPITWNLAWEERIYKRKLLLGMVVLIVLLCFLPSFFNSIENRKGIELNDRLLSHLPAYNLSIPIFVIIWGMGIFAIYRSLQNPSIFLLLLWSFIGMSLLRMITLYFFQLEAPLGLIALKDPVTSVFYGNRIITKDLFFSGHTATQFLFFLSLQKREDKLVALVTTIAIGMMVLIQHVHYTVDVIAAPILTLLAFWLTKKLANI